MTKSLLTTNNIDPRLYYIDATPDGKYALRILRHYRRECDVKFASSTSGEPETNPVINRMNHDCDLRAAELDKAIAILEKHGGKR